MDIMNFGHNSFVAVKGLKERIQEAEKENQMRPYRAIPIDGKDFVYGWYMERYDTMSFIINATPTCDTDNMIQVIPETVGQSTGLKDKNGKEIYDGDVVIIGCYKLRAVIKYEHCSFRMFHVWGSKRRKYCDDGRSELIFHNCNISTEVIYNIHQPEEQDNG